MDEVEKETQKKVYKKPSHYFGGDCKCVKCVRWRNQNAE